MSDREWPPTLADFRAELGVTDGLDEAVLQLRLDAAVSFVERARPDLDYGGGVEKPPPGDEVFLGTLALARRWYTRRSSPDGLIQMADVGTSRVTTYDPDIDRQLRIGKFRKALFA